VRAQQSAPTQSGRAAPISPLPSENDSTHSTPALSDTPDDQVSPPAETLTHVLSGAETLGLGALRDLRGVVDPAVRTLGSGGLRRIFDPVLQISEFGETGLVAGQTLIGSSVGGSLDVQQHWGHYYLTTAYRGAETIYNHPYNGLLYLPYHDGSISQELILGRWVLRLRDDVLYSWANGFTGLFTGGSAQVGNGLLNSIVPSLISSGTIQTGFDRQFYNTSVGEIDYARSRRTTLTFVGSYGLAHFWEPDFINNKYIDAQIGYDYALSAKNNIALTYNYNRVSFDGTSSRLRGHSVQMTFGRKVTGRMAFQVGVGPQLLELENFGFSNSRRLSWTAFSALTYQWHRTGYSLSYFRGTSPGSGVFVGSDSETVAATANYEITRSWSASVNGGYARNKALAPISTFANQFDNWFASANLNRQFGPQVRFGVNYGFQHQTSQGGACPVLSCGLPAPFSQFGVSLQWHPLAKGK
jgi:hypothetical protein